MFLILLTLFFVLAYLCCYGPIGWLKPLWLASFLVQLYFVYDGTVSNNSDAQGGLVWLLYLPLLLISAISMTVGSRRLTRNLRASRVKMTGLAVASFLWIFTLPQGPLHEFTTMATTSLFIAIHGKTPWEAGHGG